MGACSSSNIVQPIQSINSASNNSIDKNNNKIISDSNNNLIRSFKKYKWTEQIDKDKDNTYKSEIKSSQLKLLSPTEVNNNITPSNNIHIHNNYIPTNNIVNTQIIHPTQPNNNNPNNSNNNNTSHNRNKSQSTLAPLLIPDLPSAPILTQTQSAPNLSGNNQLKINVSSPSNTKNPRLVRAASDANDDTDNDNNNSDNELTTAPITTGISRSNSHSTRRRRSAIHRPIYIRPNSKPKLLQHLPVLDAEIGTVFSCSRNLPSEERIRIITSRSKNKYMQRSSTPT